MGKIETFGEHKARWITISTNEYESMKSTLEVLSDSEYLRTFGEKNRKAYIRPAITPLLAKTEGNYDGSAIIRQKEVEDICSSYLIGSYNRNIFRLHSLTSQTIRRIQ